MMIKTRHLLYLGWLLFVYAVPLSAQQPFLLQKDISFETTDGVQLAADVYLPAAAGAFPTVLVRTPYQKAGMAFMAASLLLFI